MTQAAMAALFQTNPQTITRHVGAIYAECEMEEGATCTSYVQVQTEGARRVRRHVRHYSLPRCRRRVVGELGEMVRIAAPAWECRDVRRRTEERLAERVGFEPTELALNGFQDRRLQPLGHLSAAHRV